LSGLTDVIWDIWDLKEAPGGIPVNKEMVIDFSEIVVNEELRGS